MYLLPCRLLGCIKWSLYSEQARTAAYPCWSEVAQQNPFVKGKENKKIERKLIGRIKKSTRFAKFSGKEQIKDTQIIWQIHRKLNWNILICIGHQCFSSWTEHCQILVLFSFFFLFFKQAIKSTLQSEVFQGGGVGKDTFYYCSSWLYCFIRLWEELLDAQGKLVLFPGSRGDKEDNSRI